MYRKILLYVQTLETFQVKKLYIKFEDDEDICTEADFVHKHLQ